MVREQQFATGERTTDDAVPVKLAQAPNSDADVVSGCGNVEIRGASVGAGAVVIEFFFLDTRLLNYQRAVVLNRR